MPASSRTVAFCLSDCQRAVRHGDYKLIAYATERHARQQLFNLREDPWEMAN